MMLQMRSNLLSLVLLALAFHSSGGAEIFRYPSILSASQPSTDPSGKEIVENQGLVQVLDDVASMLSNIPIVGGVLESGVNDLIDGLITFERATNGFLGRILGGALPCTVDLDNGMVCNGIKNRGSMSQLFKSAINHIPDILMPNIVKTMINLLIDTVFDPVMDVLFGGVPISDS